jgi:hypothetical protein
MSLDPKARERLALFAGDGNPLPGSIYAAINDVLAEVERLEQYELAFKALHSGDWDTRARALCDKVPGSLGDNIWHVCVKLAERLEQDNALLRALCVAWRKNDECYRYCEHGIGPKCDDEDWAAATDALNSARAAVDAAGLL